MVQCLATAKNVELIINGASERANVNFKELAPNLHQVISKKTTVDRGLADVVAHMRVLADPSQREDAEIQNTLKPCSPTDDIFPSALGGCCWPR